MSRARVLAWPGRTPASPPARVAGRRKIRALFLLFFILPPDAWGPCGSEIEMEVEMHQTPLKPKQIQVQVELFHSGSTIDPYSPFK